MEGEQQIIRVKSWWMKYPIVIIFEGVSYGEIEIHVGITIKIICYNNEILVITTIFGFSVEKGMW